MTTLLEQMAIAYEAERTHWKIRYDHDSKESIVFRDDEELARFRNGGAAVYSMEATRSVEAMRMALQVAVEAPLFPEVFLAVGKALGEHHRKTSEYRPGDDFIVQFRAALASIIREE